MEKREKFIGVNSIKFNRYFLAEEDCYRYLSEIKWSSEAYQCKYCGYTKYGKGKKPYSRRCTQCNYDESPTARTMFDKCKFSLLIAFHIAFKISTKKKGMSSEELSEEFELRQMTCWEFKWKVQQAMQSSGRYPLKGVVHVDEFYIGGEEEGGKRGRGKGNKRLVIIALEIANGGFGRAYAAVIKDASSDSFKPFFEKYIDKDADVVTDEWAGYKPIKSTYKKMRQIPSNSGKSFPELHIHIMNIKSWLRGIHHHCSEERLQGYLDEYHFRYNRRNNMDSIFDVLMHRMVQYEPKRLNNRNKITAT
jgi:transposase-like protein